MTNILDPKIADFKQAIFDLFLPRSINQFSSLCMEMPDIVCYGDGYYQCTIYGIGPYITDYPEQVLLACAVQGWCPR